MSSSPHPWRRHLLSLFAITVSLIAIILCVHDATRHKPAALMAVARDTAEETTHLREILYGPHVQSGQVCRELASNPANDALVVWLLTDRHAFDPPSAVSRKMPIEDFFYHLNRHQIAFLMEHLHTQCGPALLLAVTNHLTDLRGARYSTATPGPMFTVRRAECVTRPLREIARDILARELGVDCEYDVEKWRQKILEK